MSLTDGGRAVLRRLLCVFLCTLLTVYPLTSAYTELSDDSLRLIPSGGDDFDVYDGALLSPILIPRVPGTPGSEKVRDHFVTFFRKNLPLWTIEWHNSTATTPATGAQQIPFTNLIFRRDPPWAAPGDVGRLTLAAHYDSLYRPDGFIGATDSAVPCAILLHVARSIDAALTKKWDAMVASGHTSDGLEEETGVQILLFDGEEAWETWSRSDSLYGSRSAYVIIYDDETLANLDQSSSRTLGIDIASSRLYSSNSSRVYQPLHSPRSPR
jgi:hypothetical protein